MNGLKSKIVIAVLILLALLIGLGITTKDNWRLQERMQRKDAKYQQKLLEFKEYSDSTEILLKEWQHLTDSLENNNKEITEDQRVKIIDLTAKRKKNHEKIASIRTWSDNERDAFWAEESIIQDTIIYFPTTDNP